MQHYHSWHFTVKEEILKEINNFKQDFAAYTDGTLLLTYENSLDPADGSTNYAEDNQNNASTSSKEQRNPKSKVFSYAVAPFLKLRKKNRLWKRKRKKNNSDTAEVDEASSYQPPNIV